MRLPALAATALMTLVLLPTSPAQQLTRAQTSSPTNAGASSLPKGLPSSFVRTLALRPSLTKHSQSSTSPSSPYAAGIISTIAGGAFNQKGSTALTIGLGYPVGYVRDGSGNSYVTAEGTNFVFTIDGSGTAAVVVGNGSGSYSGDGGPGTSATVNSPTALALDNSGDLYIADTANYVIRKLNLSTGIITTVAGEFGLPGDSGDGGPAANARIGSVYGMAYSESTGTLYFSDIAFGVVRQISPTGTISTVAGAAYGTSSYGCSGQTDGYGDGCPAQTAKLVQPTGLTLDAKGNLYISDTSADIVHVVNMKSGTITLFAGQANASGQPVSGFSGDGGPATSALLDSPGSLTVDNSGNIYITDSGNAVIRKVTSGIINSVAGTPSQFGFAGDGGPATQAQFNFSSVSAITVDATSNDLYIVDSGNERVRQVISNGNVQTIAGNGYANYSGNGGPAANAGLANPTSLVEDKAGNLYIADRTNSTVREVLAGSGAITTIAGTGALGYSGDGGPATSATLGQPVGLALDSSGNIFIADAGYNVVREVSAATGIISTVAGQSSGKVCSAASDKIGDGCPATQASLNYPWSVAFDANGNLYIADAYNSVVREVAASTGIISTVAGTPGQFGFSGDGGLATSAELNSPFAIAFDAGGNLYIADTGNSRIREIHSSTGIIQTIAGNGTYGYAGDGGPATSAEISYVYGLFTDVSGDVFIGDTNNNVIREINASDQAIVTIAGNGTAGFSGDSGPATQAELSDPSGVLIDATGNLIFADQNNQRVRKVTATSQGGSTLSATTTTLTTSNASVVQGTSITFTANVTSSTTGTPTGMVTFLDGTTTLGAAILSNAAATFTTSSLSAGSHSITALYSGDIYFASSTSAAITETVSATPPSFSTTAANNGTITISSGSTGTITLTTTATGGYTGTVDLSCLPSSSTFSCIVSPQALTFTTGGPESLTAALSITTSVNTGYLQLPADQFGGSSSMQVYSAMVLWLPGSALVLFGLRRRKKLGKPMRGILMLMVISIGIAGTGSLTGCGSIEKAINCAESGGSNCSSGGSTNTPAGSYTVTVTSTDGTIKKTTTINVTVQ